MSTLQSPQNQAARRRIRPRAVAIAVAVLLLAAVVALTVRTWFRYHTAPVMDVVVREFTNAEYPEDPARRSVHHGQYNGRRLVLERKDATHFDFIFEPTDPRAARVAFRDVDVALMTPSLPAWAKADDGLRRVALTDRQWNRQQVRFDRHSAHVEVTGGDGFEREHLETAELAKNCLNAGLWEVLLYTKEGGEKALYYQGWFTFPLGHYKDVFEANTDLPYWKHWYYLEHWSNPAGTLVNLEGLRRVTAEREVSADFDLDEPVLAAGEQLNKRRTMLAENVVAWKDVFDGRPVRFASFIPPGRYSVQHPWGNEYPRMKRFEKAILRETESPGGGGALQELELAFSGSQGSCRFLVGGIDLDSLPRLRPGDYPAGLYMPMGIGTPPFFQSYDELVKSPPDQSRFFSLMLDGEGRWINHHDLAIDGPVMHRDFDDPHIVHLYLLSYERHTLIGHFRILFDR